MHKQHIFILCALATFLLLTVQRQSFLEVIYKQQPRADSPWWVSEYNFTQFIDLKEIENQYQQNLRNKTLSVRPNIKGCLLTSQDFVMLYTLGYCASGPIMEEGCFSGCSTIALARGLKDRAQADGTKPHTFYTSDVFPASWNDNNSPIGYKHVPNSGDKSVSLQIWGREVLRFPSAGFKRQMLPVLNSPGGVLHTLYNSLYTNNIHDVVKIAAGGSASLPLLPYRLIWSDAAHSLQEIHANEAGWKRFIHHGYRVIFAFHDVGISVEAQNYLKSSFSPTHTFKVGPIWCMEIAE